VADHAAVLHALFVAGARARAALADAIGGVTDLAVVAVHPDTGGLDAGRSRIGLTGLPRLAEDPIVPGATLAEAVEGVAGRPWVVDVADNAFTKVDFLNFVIAAGDAQ